MATRIVPSRRCQCCGDRIPLDELVVTEVIDPENNVYRRARTCGLCAAQIQLAFILDWNPEFRFWYHAP